jgi:hypothetical protein
MGGKTVQQGPIESKIGAMAHVKMVHTREYALGHVQRKDQCQLRRTGLQPSFRMRAQDLSH